MRLIVGLGNLGDQYQAHRHNFGFMVLDHVAKAQDLVWKREKKWHADITRCQDVCLAKPTTLMNLSGRCVQAIAQFYKIRPEEILVIYDDLDVSLGSIKLKFSGGAAGHNGIKDIIANIGSDFWRMRLGIGHPEGRAQVHDYVLSAFSKDEVVIRDQVLDQVLPFWPLILSGAFEDIQKHWHTKES